MLWQPPQYPTLRLSSHKYLWRALALLCLIVIGIIVDACGSVEKDYKYFHWFVDGIPEPGSVETTSGQTHISSFLAGGAQQISPGTIYYSHKPWADENCHACHQGVSQFSMPGRDDSQICMPCHEKVVDEYRYMHGAVVSVACLWCHAPHLSQYEHLLRAKPTEICLQCHSTEDGSLLLEKEHADLTRNCLDCHFGHGSEEPGFLKPKQPPSDNSEVAGPPTPPTPPTTDPATNEQPQSETPEPAPDGDSGQPEKLDSGSVSDSNSDSVMKENH